MNLSDFGCSENNDDWKFFTPLHPPPDIWEFDAFRAAIGVGMFNDDDGYGVFVNGERRGEAVSPKEFYMGTVQIPEWASHIEWCGK